jgi:hypothetical protein
MKRLLECSDKKIKIMERGINFQKKLEKIPGVR